MGLHDRLRSTNGGGQEAVIARVENTAREAQPEGRVADPYAELKTRVHHACIAKLGPELFSAQTNEDL